MSSPRASRLVPFALAVAVLAAPLALVAPAAAEPVPAIAPAAVAVSCDAGSNDDFFFESFDADYYLDTDDDGRSVLTTVETFVAVFPDIDQNQGMRRAIPGSYQGAPTDVEVQSVTDGDGNPRPYTLETDDDGFLLVTSAADECVHGAQTYVFTYTQHNVTRYFADTDDDEFFWDTNGTGWYQSFGSVASRVHVPSHLASSLTGQSACYRGYEGSTDTCELTVSEGSDETVIETSVTDLAPFENVTVAIGFEPHTFVPRDDSYFASPVAIVQIVGVLGSVIALIWAIVLRATRFADGRGRPTIIAEYTPPKGLDPFTAAVVLGKTSRGAAAAFVNLAVTRRIRIVETEKKGWFSSGTTYLLELVDPSGLAGPELNLAQALFGYQLQPGTTYLMSGKDTTLSEHVRGILQSATAAATTSGLRKKGTAKFAVLPTLIVILSGVLTAVIGFGMIGDSRGGLVPLALMVVSLIAALVVFGLLFRKPLSDQGAELRDHLKGLELYIRLAEADRLRMLQSPGGAEKEAVSTSDPRQVVLIYEKLLPYAVLFGLEKQWASVLGTYYTEQSPDWYSGSGAFNAAVFASSISSISSTAASSYSGSSSSSSSGGSGGGGSSGGGGGGGGGGGV
jgi:uncharacterized membrane protein YgcG